MRCSEKKKSVMPFAQRICTCSLIKRNGNGRFPDWTWSLWRRACAIAGKASLPMLLLKGQMTHRATLGTDPRGNLTRIDNALSQMPQRLEAVKNQLDNLYQQQAAAKAEVGKPFPQEQELRDKSARLAELDVLLNMDGRGRPAPEAVLAKSSRPSVLEGLKRPVPPRCPEKKPKHHEQEVR